MRALFATVLLVLLATWATAQAGITMPYSFAKLSADEKRIFVMVPSDRRYEDENPVTFVLPDGRTIVLHKTFAKSGCYDANTLAPFWQVEWYFLETELLFSSDLSNVAALIKQGYSSDDGVAFFHDGKLVRIYHISDLLTALNNPFLLPYSTWDWHVRWYSDFELEGNQVTLTTARRRVSLWGRELDLGLYETYRFDLSTGTMISSDSSGTGKIWLYLGLVLAIVLIPPLAFLGLRRPAKSLG